LKWFEVSEDLWREPSEITQKLRGIEVRTAQEPNIHLLSDEGILHEATKRGLVLITLDRDFWSDDTVSSSICGKADLRRREG
jgi:hypothetical protein